MSAAMVIDTLAYSNRLKAAGVPATQAEVHAESLGEILGHLENHFATKQDIIHLEHKIETLDHKIDTVESALTAKIGAVDTKLNWLISLVSVVGIVLALINILVR